MTKPEVIDRGWRTLRPLASERHGRRRSDLTPVLDHQAIARYILSRRTPEGGYSYYRTPEWRVEEPNALDTLAALDSLRLLDIDPPGPDATATWLRELQDDSGGYPSLTIGWAALRSLALLGAPPTRSPEPWLVDQDLPGTASASRSDWRGTFQDLLRVCELSRLFGIWSQDASVRVARLLREARDDLGGWARPGPELATSARAIKVALICELDLDQPESLGDFVRSCEDGDLGFRMTPTGRATSTSAIWGGLEILRSFDMGPRFPEAIAKNLALTQRSDGGIGERHRALSTLGATWRALEAEGLLSDVMEGRS